MHVQMEFGKRDEWKRLDSSLSTEGALVEKLTDGDITESEISRYFGPCASKSGWKFADPAFITAEEAASILSLYRRVYAQKNIPNGEIILAFARGLVYQSQKQKPVNWDEFARRR